MRRGGADVGCVLRRLLAERMHHTLRANETFLHPNLMWSAEPFDHTERKPVAASHAAGRWPRCILVASHGTTSAVGAIHAARTLSKRCGASLSIVTVYPPEIPVPAASGRRGLEQCEGPERSEAERLLHAVRCQCVGDKPGDDLAPRLEVGDPVATILRLADETCADLVVVGLGRRDPHARQLGERTPSSI